MRLMGSLKAFLMVILIAGADGALADVTIKVDKATQRMSVSVDGQEQYSWKVSTGLPGYETPKGSYTPFRLEEDHYSKEWDDAPMPHSIFFTSRGHAIHGSDVVRRLGSPASHGCIRLSRENAATLFALVQEQGLNKAKVVVSGDEAFVTARKRSRMRVAERSWREQRTAARQPGRAERGADDEGGWLTRPYYREPQPFWSPSPYGARGNGYGWR